jgi:hypothetical protein
MWAHEAVRCLPLRGLSFTITRAGMALEKLAYQSLGRGLVAVALHKHIGHRALLIDGPPQPMLPAVDRHHHFVRIACRHAPAPSSDSAS